MLSKVVTLVDDEGTLKYILREDFLLYMNSTGANNENQWLSGFFAPHPRGLMVVDLDYAVVNNNPEALRILGIPKSEIHNAHIDKLLGIENFLYVKNTQNCLINQFIPIAPNNRIITVDFLPVVMNQVVCGYALAFQDNPTIEKMADELETVKQLNIDLIAILSTTYDEVVICDAKGIILRASKHFIASNWNRSPNTYAGQQIFKIKPEEDLIYRVVQQVQKQKRKVSLMQNPGNSPSLSMGIPVLQQSGQLERIIIASRDLTNESRLQQELEQTRQQSENYRQELEQLRARAHGIVPLYASPLMHEVMKEVERVAQFSATVLLTGESGVGKEVIATSIHSMGQRRDEPFVKINCAAIPETLLESELFGYERGAFSGANQQGKTGLLVKADKGCLFLDEISELPSVIQGKLLRAIQEREVYPVGATEPIKFDIQIIAATNRPLNELVAEGKFREDLYYRINVFPIEIPPLRERIEDISLLANDFLTEFNQIYHRQLRFSGDALELLEAYPFPGNVRELQNLVQRIAIRNEGDIINPEVIERILMHGNSISINKSGRFKQVISLEEAYSQVEEELVTLAMKQYNSTTKAAKALGVSQATVSRKYRQIQGKGQQKID